MADDIIKKYFIHMSVVGFIVFGILMFCLGRLSVDEPSPQKYCSNYILINEKLSKELILVKERHISDVNQTLKDCLNKSDKMFEDKIKDYQDTCKKTKCDIEKKLLCKGK